MRLVEVLVDNVVRGENAERSVIFVSTLNVCLMSLMNVLLFLV